MKKLISTCFSVLLVFTSYCQVNQQTGSAVYNIPVFNYSDSKSGLSAGIGLNYNSGYGFKVNQMASAAGYGWAINAGGVIERVQNGEPDDQYNPVNYGFSGEDQIIKRELNR
jgi:hypothetical protein